MGTPSFTPRTETATPEDEVAVAARTGS